MFSHILTVFWGDVRNVLLVSTEVENVSTFLEINSFLGSILVLSIIFLCHLKMQKHISIDAAR